MKPVTRWAVVKEGEVLGIHGSKHVANIHGHHAGACHAVECTLLPTADLERLMRAANKLLNWMQDQPQCGCEEADAAMIDEYVTACDAVTAPGNGKEQP